MFNNSFTVSVVNGNVPTINKAALAKTNEPMRAQKNRKEANVTKREVLTIHAPLHKLNKCKQIDPSKQAFKLADESNLANSKISEVYFQANYENDKTIQKVIRLVKKTAIVSRLLPHWREKFPSFSV